MSILINLLIFNFILFYNIVFIKGFFFPKINNTTELNSSFRWTLPLFFSLLFFALILYFRDTNVRGDYQEYVKFYKYLEHTGKLHYLIKEKEFLFNQLNILFTNLHFSYNFFFAFIAMLTWIFYIKGSYKFQFLLPLMFYFLITNGFYFWTLDGIRQSIAITIFFFSIIYIIERKFLYFILLILLASLFHKSILVLFPVYFLNSIKFNRIIFFNIYIISIIFLSSDYIHNLLSTAISYISNYFDFVKIYSKSLESEVFAADSSRVDSGLGTILRITSSIYIIYKSKYILEKYPIFNIYYILYFIGAIGSNLFYSIQLMDRIFLYFSLTFTVVIATTVYFSNNKVEKYISIMIIVAFYLMFIKGLL